VNNGFLTVLRKADPDEEIFDRVFISQSVIKKTWRSAYERVDAFGLLDLERLRSAANYFD
jgi:hypothetical protein